MNKAKLTLLLSYISVATVSAAVITPALPAIGRAFAVSKGYLGWIVTLYLLGYMIGQLIYGPIANRFGRLCALRSGLLVYLTGTGFSFLAVEQHSFNLLIFSRFITALGAAAGLCCTFVLIKEYLNEEQAKQASSLAILFFSLGIGIAIMLGGWITTYLHWQMIFSLMLAYGIFMFAGTYFFQETLQQKKALHIKHIIKSYARTLHNGKFIIYSLMLGCIATFSYAYTAAAPQIANHYLLLNPAQYASWNSLTIIGMILSGIICTKLIKRHSMKKIMALSFISTFIGLASFALQMLMHSHSTLWFFVSAAFIYTTISFIFPCASHYALAEIEDKASASSMMNFINMATAVIGVTVMGYLPMSMFMAMITVSGTIIIITLLALYLNNIKQQSSSLCQL